MIAAHVVFGAALGVLTDTMLREARIQRPGAAVAARGARMRQRVTNAA
jgi:hypothetical protein